MVALKKPLMFVGNAGSAKTVIVNVLLKGLNEDEWLYNIISYNSFTISRNTQGMLEAPLEKKTGSIFGPPGTKKLIYFIDDFNMPAPDKYGTQSAIAILRQHRDYGGFYDLKTLRMKRLDNTLLVSAMNPTAGSFFIIDRMQRHFCTLATPFPDADVLVHIYKNIMSGHFEIFSESIRNSVEQLVTCAVTIHNQVADAFVPSAVKFHYQWNLRALAASFQGLATTSPATYKQPALVARLLLHEVNRVYGDRMVSESDVERFQEIILKNAKAFLGEYNFEELTAEPILFSTFVEEAEGDVKLYLPLKDYDHLSKILTKQLHLYNEQFAVMNLVLFNQAMEHVTRISRIIDNPRGNAMLVGVGGSGKQSLTRLASFIGGYEVFQIKLTSSYGIADFKEDLRAIYMKSGVKNIPITFLFTDQQIFNENCLIFLNDILSLGYPPGLFAEEDKDTIINGVRNAAKQAGVMDSRDAMWAFFVQQVRAMLHMCICMSPVGDKFRNRCRKFPALTSGTAINWFFNWPQQALISVANRFLAEVEMEKPEIRDFCAGHMSFVHESVGVAAEQYRARERREVYTTPKSYLELIALYKDELAANRQVLQVLKTALVEGLLKLNDASQQVADMQVQLKEESAFVEKKSKETDELIVVVGKESVIAEEEGAKAAIEEAEVAEIAKGVAEFQEQANKDLAAAEPAIEKAMAALGGLNKAALGELKGLASPPAAVLNVTAAVTYMLAPKGANLKKLDITWGGAKKLMGDVQKFLDTLTAFDKDNFLLENKAKVRDYTGTIPDPKNPDNKDGLTMGFDGVPNPEFNYDYMKAKSSAAAGLCDWIVNICIYHDIYLDVAPKRAKLAAAEQELAAANKKLAGVRAHVAALDQKMAELGAQLEEATTEKNALVAKAEATQKRANLAMRLVNGLSSEGVRWESEVASLDEKMRLLVGDVMLSSSFVAYIAPFSREFRDELIGEKWRPDAVARGIPMTGGFDPMTLLTDASKTAGWRSEGLPADPLSTQNASIICKCARFPLIIDPQMQAVKWIMGREKANGLITTVPGAKGWLDKVVRAIEEGVPLLLENMKDVIEAILDNLVARAYVRKGTKMQVALGDRVVDILMKKDADGQSTDFPCFKVYMQSRLPNPHYIPEVQAQTTLVNFTVTEKGLEDQLLSVVVGHERPDLLQEQKDLVEMQNNFTIELKRLGDNLLNLLATAEGDILSNEALIITLEETKVTVNEINAKGSIAAKKEIEIAQTFESYRVDAARGSLIYFLMNKLGVMGPMYQYSLAAFNFIFYKALDKARQPEPDEAGNTSVSERVQLLLESVTYSLFKFVSSGLFERHRLTFGVQLAINISRAQMSSEPEALAKMAKELELLVRPTVDNSRENPVASWVTDETWALVCGLASAHDDFASLPQDLEGSWKRWKEWSEHPTPETEQLPTDWKRLGGFQQLLIMRAIRPDRITLSLRSWVVSVLGHQYGEAINFDLPLSFEDSGPAVPVFFLLSPGVDATAEVRALGKAQPTVMDEDGGRLITVSLGQGQEPVAEKALDLMHSNGGWAMLENIELVAGWLPKLEKKLEALEEGADPLFRTFLSAMPQPVVPVPILQKSIKLTNEPPTGLKANLKRAYLNFTEAIWENSTKQAEYKALIFALCFFHSVACERRKFGPLGWNRGYPFNPGDLKDSIAVANNYLEAGGAIPWDDLRYLFGEIFYGGHITDNYDRKLCTAYLLTYVRVEILEGCSFFPGFQSPGTTNYKGYIEYIEDSLDRETPIAYGLHPNAEINFMTQQATTLFEDVSNLSPKGSSGGEGGMTLSEKVKLTLDDILERLPDLFPMLEIMERIDDVTPYTGVFLQECERMNALLFEMRRSLIELDMGLKGDLSITEPMEKLMDALGSIKTPMSWEKLAWASRDSLSGWLTNLLLRQNQLSNWTGDLVQPKVTWVSGLFNAQAFVNAVKQVTSRKNDWALNKLVTTVDVTKKMTPEEVEGTARDGAYVNGLFIEGARWDMQAGVLEDSFMKELYPKMPVIQMRAILAEKEDLRGVYVCPVYKQTERATPGTATPGTGFVFAMQLKTKQPASKWTMAGVAMLLGTD
uniref:Dynein heavy chain n=1 Tax=Haptolina brevifila TaxID=156173 RepID=A0A7S2NI24_9EUKA